MNENSNLQIAFANGNEEKKLPVYSVVDLIRHYGKEILIQKIEAFFKENNFGEDISQFNFKLDVNKMPVMIFDIKKVYEENRLETSEQKLETKRLSELVTLPFTSFIQNLLDTTFPDNEIENKKIAVIASAPYLEVSKKKFSITFLI